MGSESRGYERDPRAVAWSAEPLARGEDERGPWVLLADTLLYPGGGGQPEDRGWVDGIEVVALEPQSGGVLHRLASPLPAAGAVRHDVTTISAAMVAALAGRALAAGRELTGPEPLYLRAPDVTLPAGPKRVGA